MENVKKKLSYITQTNVKFTSKYIKLNFEVYCLISMVYPHSYSSSEEGSRDAIDPHYNELPISFMVTSHRQGSSDHITPK